MRTGRPARGIGAAERDAPKPDDQVVGDQTEDEPSSAAGDPPRDAGAKDPTRRAALVATVVTLPVVVATLIAVNTGHRPSSGGAAVTSAPASARPDAVVEVATPPTTAEAEALCPALMERLPLDLVGDSSRRVAAESPFAYAWGEPPTVLVCGVQPIAFPPDSLLQQINGVSWFVDGSDPMTIVWTTVDRQIALQLRIPSSTDGMATAALGPIIDAAIPPVS